MLFKNLQQPAESYTKKTCNLFESNCLILSNYRRSSGRYGADILWHISSFCPTKKVLKPILFCPLLHVSIWELSVCCSWQRTKPSSSCESLFASTANTPPSSPQSEVGEWQIYRTSCCFLRRAPGQCRTGAGWDFKNYLDYSTAAILRPVKKHKFLYLYESIQGKTLYIVLV